MRKALQISGHLFWAAILTLLSQVGGFVWLMAVGLNALVVRRKPIKGLLGPLFLGIYLLVSFVLIPPVARICFNRVPLPVFDHPYVKPENLFFPFLNRTYVKPELRKALIETAEKMQESFPGAVIWYLDANFPLIDGYPLEPHFSHKDGKKVDLSFYWKEKKTGQPVPKNPSPSGYGLYAEPTPGEFNYAEHCINKGFWHISIDEDLGSWAYDKNDYIFDEDRTQLLLRLLAQHPSIGKILIQPHLKKRLKLEGFDAIRAQGCRAARHDDHAHVQLK